MVCQPSAIRVLCPPKRPVATSMVDTPKGPPVLPYEVCSGNEATAALRMSTLGDCGSPLTSALNTSTSTSASAPHWYARTISEVSVEVDVARGDRQDPLGCSVRDPPDAE